MRAMDAAKEFEVACQSDPNLERARALRRKAAAVQEAARATREADELEAESEKLVKSIDASAELELGRLLYKRRIKPGAMVVLWSAANGEHKGELSKRQFREACESIGLAPGNDGAIEDVFKEFDEDGGGYLDEGEAMAMIKGLQKKAEAAEGRKRLAENAAFSMRAKAKRLAASAFAPLVDDSSLPQPPPLPPPGAGVTGGGSAANEAEEARRRAKAKKKREAAAAATATVRASSHGAATAGGAAALAPAGQEAGQEAGQQEATREEMALARAREAAAALAHGPVAVAFRTWRDARAEMHERLMLLARAVAYWSEPSLSFAFGLWAEQSSSSRDACCASSWVWRTAVIPRPRSGVPWRRGRRSVRGAVLPCA